MESNQQRASVQGQARRDAYDVVVVGSGIAGLSAAAVLAKSGKRVLVVERHHHAGGYVHSFRRGAFHFDAAVHLVGGCGVVNGGPGGLIHRLLDLLGVREKCTFLPVDPLYAAIFPGLRVAVPGGLEAFVEAHVREFPGERAGLEKLVALCAEIYREVPLDPIYLSFWQTVQMVKRFPSLRSYERATVADVLDQHLSDPRLKSLFATLWPYTGLPPTRLSFVFWSVLLMNYVVDGSFYCQGTFARLSEALVSALVDHGGELVLGCGAQRIVTKDGQVRGVLLDGGQQIEVPVVISNADATQTFDDLVGVDQLPDEFVAGYRRLRPSLSACVVYLGTDLDLRALGACHAMLAYRSWDHAETHSQMLAGRPTATLITIPTLSDPSIAPPGQNIIVGLTPVPFASEEHWADVKSRYVDTIVALVADLFPGLKDHITFVEGATPHTLRRYSRNTGGAMYGWEHSPDQAGLSRLGHNTPVRGLYLAGHWTRPGGGVYAAVGSGLGAAQAVLGTESAADLMAALGSPS
jgi:phytoene desaturase